MAYPSDDFDIAASWAQEPFFYEAPVPDRLPEGWHVMRFQLAAAEYCVARNHALIGDEPGVTKTAESILVGNAIGAKRTLVVCPASLRLNWESVWRRRLLTSRRPLPVGRRRQLKNF